MKPDIVFILVGAARRRGKDTLAGILANKINDHEEPVSARVYSFAYELRLEVQKALRDAGSYIDVFTEDPVLKEKVVRPLLISWGQMRRHQDPSYWVKKLVRVVEHSAESSWGDGTFFAIISDWRFPNEFVALNSGKYAVRTVHIDRPNIPYAGPDEQENDPLCSAMSMSHCYNRGTLTDLSNWADAYLAQFLSNYKPVTT